MGTVARVVRRRAPVATGMPPAEDFRAWMQVQLERTGKSMNMIETEAGIPGNALGKWLRAERGHSGRLSTLHIQRLAPVIGVSEEMLLHRAGHATRRPDTIAYEAAVLADQRLSYEDKMFLIDFYRRMVATDPAAE